MKTFVFSFILAALLAKNFPFLKENNGVYQMIKINKTAIKKEYGTDTTKALEGVWKDVTMIPGMRVKVAKTSNTAYVKLMRSLYKPHARIVRTGIDLPKAIEDAIDTQLIAQTILTDWEGVPGEDEKGNAAFVPYSVEAATELLSDPELKELKDEIMQYADDFASFKVEFTKDSKKS